MEHEQRDRRLSYNLKEAIIKNAEEIIDDRDPSHDRHHMRRVLSNAIYIARCEGGDLYTLVPMAAFHDVVVYPKESSMSKMSAIISAAIAGQRLREIDGYDENRIPEVMQGIREHSPRYGGDPSSLESQILQDADSLEKVGAIAIMRSFTSGGRMGRQMFCSEAPLYGDQRDPDPSLYTLDYIRKIYVMRHWHTRTAHEFGLERLNFMYAFMKQAESEIADSRKHYL